MQDENDEEDTITLKRPPPTFQQKMKQLREENGMASFKFYKYEFRTNEEQKMIEDALMEKMERWEYDT